MPGAHFPGGGTLDGLPGKLAGVRDGRYHSLTAHQEKAEGRRQGIAAAVGVVGYNFALGEMMESTAVVQNVYQLIAVGEAFEEDSLRAKGVQLGNGRFTLSNGGYRLPGQQFRFALVGGDKAG